MDALWAECVPSTTRDTWDQKDPALGTQVPAPRVGLPLRVDLRLRPPCKPPFLNGPKSMYLKASSKRQSGHHGGKET